MSRRHLTRAELIRQNRGAIDGAIRALCPNVGTLNDRDRAQWLDNDEGLYVWAREACRAGCPERRPVYGEPGFYHVG